MILTEVDCKNSLPGQLGFEELLMLNVKCFMTGADAVKLLKPNIALNGEATQSSNFDDGYWLVPDYSNSAIDGKFDTDIEDFKARCAVT